MVDAPTGSQIDVSDRLAETERDLAVTDRAWRVEVTRLHGPDGVLLHGYGPLGRGEPGTRQRMAFEARRAAVAAWRQARARGPTLTGLALVLIVVLQAAPVRAQADRAGEEAMALLRAASAQSAIIVFCAKLYAVDGTTALRISQTSREVAAKVLGRPRAEAAFKEELARRYDEVKDVGEAGWCAGQREAFANDGVGLFKD